MDVIPIEEVLDEHQRANPTAETRAAIAEADVIIAIDGASQCQFTVFGTPALEETVPVGTQLALRTLRIGFDQKSGQLDKLHAVVQAIKRGQDQLTDDE